MYINDGGDGFGLLVLVLVIGIASDGGFDPGPGTDIALVESTLVLIIGT